MKGYIKLIRPYGMLFLGLTSVFGAICNGEFRLLNLSILCIIGMLIHIFTFVQNDYYDIEIDKVSKYVIERPLSSGEIAKKNVLIIIVCSFIISLILAVVFFFSIASIFILIVTFILVTLYNKLSKKVSMMEYILGAAIFSFGLYGALTVSNTISPFALLVSFIGFFQWIFNVGISANLKDVKYDANLGIKTTPILFGVKVVNNKIVTPQAFKLYAFGLKIIHIIIASLPFVFLFTSLSVFNLPIPLVCFLILSVLMIYTTHQILSAPYQKRDTLLRYEGIHEGFALLLIPIVLMDYLITNIGLFITLFILGIIIVWPLFSLRVLFGKKMIPLE